MLFNSWPFAIFFITVFFLYWFVFKNNLNSQNIFLLISCYVFYAWWDWRFLSLLVIASLIYYRLGYYIDKTTNLKTKRKLVNAGIFIGVALLGYFKYINFFISSFISLFNDNHINVNTPLISIILPLGISFYTFRMMSYLFDINRGKIKATDSWVIFFTYIAFFPSLISGPIDKADLLIPQLSRKREVSYATATDGLRQILWGLTKKIVIADNCSVIAGQLFDNYHVLPGSSLLVGAFFYTIQIYADFSGYSDMAIGIARLLGFNITRNFDSPFFAQNIADFWRRWHISLTTWLTDYLFTPLSIYFRDYGKFGLILSILINFTVIGIWHGANWTFVLFGVLHGCYYIPLILKGTLNKKKKFTAGKALPTFTELRNIAGTFVLVMLTFILFRSNNLTQALSFYKKLFSKSLLTVPVIISPAIQSVALVGKKACLATLFAVIVFMIIEWQGKQNQYAIANFGLKWSRPARWAFYYLLLVIIYTTSGGQQQFIYFKF